MNHYTILGRLLGDDDDSCFITEAKDLDDALNKFKEWIECCRDCTYDEEAYVSYVLTSETPIQVVLSLGVEV